VLTVGVGVGQAFALVELGADQNVDDQAVRHVQSADSGSRQVRVATDAADDTDRQAAPHDLRVSGYQHAHVGQGRKRAGQVGRDIGRATGLDQVGQFGCNEVDLFLALLHAA